MRRHLSPALVLSVLAIILASTAGATAASSLITGKQIKNSSITGADIKNRSLGGDDLKSASIGPSKLSDGLVSDITAGKEPGPVGPVGPAGPAGAQGPAGPAGPSAVSGLNTVSGSKTIGAGAIDGGIMSCPAGQRIVSGGWFSDSGTAFLDRPNGDRSGWAVGIDNSGSTISANLTVYAMCAGTGQAVAARTHARGLRPFTKALATLAARRR